MANTDDILQQHATRLEDHSRQLQALQSELVHQRNTLNNVTTTLQQIQTQISTYIASMAAMDVSLVSIKELLDKEGAHKSRLIYILVGALIILAGVTKLADLGII